MKYKAQMDVIDIYGDQQKYSGWFHYPMLPLVGLARDVTLGSWTIEGILYCCP